MAPESPANSGTSILVGLKANTTLHVKAYAKSSSDVFWGNELNFKPPQPPMHPKAASTKGRR